MFGLHCGEKSYIILFVVGGGLRLPDLVSSFAEKKEKYNGKADLPSRGDKFEIFDGER